VLLKISVRKPYPQVQEGSSTSLLHKKEQFSLYLMRLSQNLTLLTTFPLKGSLPFIFFSNLFFWLPSQLGLFLCYFFIGTSSLVHSFFLEDQVDRILFLSSFPFSFSSSQPHIDSSLKLPNVHTTTCPTHILS